MKIRGQLYIFLDTLIFAFLTLSCVCKSTEGNDANQRELQVRRAVCEMSMLSEDLHGNRSKTDYGKKYQALLQYAEYLDERTKAEVYKVISVRIVTVPAKPFPATIEDRELFAWDSIDALLATTNSKELVLDIISTTPPYQVGHEFIREYLEKFGIDREDLAMLVTKCKSRGAQTFIEDLIQEYDENK